ncbi:hypothetical protein CBR_g22323 [Chara braunii]|uniref:Uncharacterized protein n=1 Tax=Chara braunii TaxID=69332 RepID=A0A388JUN9_CHABU|nr:hypothetical protein CBR_g22323 [Chara braunii]|eukprot:GBG61526.1 hypothetical protein CBR_g22323 [Chara braunii]
MPQYSYTYGRVGSDVVRDCACSMQRLISEIGRETDRQGGRFLIRLKEPTEGEETFLGILSELVVAYGRIVQDIRVGYLFRGRRGNGPLGGSRFNKRIEKWFGEAGVYEGETGHNFRIGGVQADIEEGWSLGEMMRQGTWKSVGTFMRYGYGMKRGWKRKGDN